MDNTKFISKYGRYPTLAEELAQKEMEAKEPVILCKGEVIDILKTLEGIKRRLQTLLKA